MVLHGHKSNTAVAHPLPPAVRQCATDSISRGICSLRSHIPCRLRRALQKGTKKPLEQALRHLRSLLRREGDSNPRNPQGVQQFSRLPRSTTPASLLQFRLQIYAEAESNANEFIQFALPRRNSICGRQAKYTQKPEANEFIQFALPRRTVYAAKPNIRRN